MAGIQLPTLNRFQPTNTPSVGRMNYDVPDATKAMAPQTKALEDLGEKAFKMYEEHEARAVDSLTDDLLFKGEIAQEQMLDEARKIEGDPTPVYEKLNADRQKLREQIFTENEGMSARARSVLEQKLAKSDRLFEMKRVTAQGIQATNYEEKVAETAIVKRQNDLFDAAGFIAAGEPSSMAAVQSILHDIRKAELSRPSSRGLITKTVNAEGQEIETVNPIAEENVRKAQAKGLLQTIETLTATGETGKAQMLTDQYQSILSAADKEKVAKGIRTKDDSKEAARLFIETETMSASAADKYIREKTKEMDPGRAAEILIDVRGKRSTRDHQVKFQRDQLQDQIANTLTGRLINAPVGKYLTWDAFKSDPENAMSLSHANSKTVQALQASFSNGPKISDPEARAKLNDAIANGWEGVTPAQKMEIMAGLNKADRGMADRNYTKMISPNASESRSRQKYADSELTKEMRTLRIIGNPGPDGYSVKELERISEAKDQLISVLDDLPKTAGDKEIREIVKGVAASMKKGEIFQYTPAAGSARPQTFNGVTNKAAVKYADIREMPAADRARINRAKNLGIKNVINPSPEDAQKLLSNQ